MLPFDLDANRRYGCWPPQPPPPSWFMGRITGAIAAKIEHWVSRGYGMDGWRQPLAVKWRLACQHVVQCDAGRPQVSLGSRVLLATHNLGWLERW